MIARIMTTLCFLGSAALFSPLCIGGAFESVQILELQNVPLGHTYDSYIEREHRERTNRVNQVHHTADWDLHDEFAPFLSPNRYNTIHLLLDTDGTGTAAMLDTEDTRIDVIYDLTYERYGRIIYVDVEISSGQILTFTGKAPRDNRTCYQGVSENSDPSYPGYFWVSYWEGCRDRL